MRKTSTDNFYAASKKHIKNRAEWEKSIKRAKACIGLQRHWSRRNDKNTTLNCSTFVRVCGKHKTVSCYITDIPLFKAISSYEISGLGSLKKSKWTNYISETSTKFLLPANKAQWDKVSERIMLDQIPHIVIRALIRCCFVAASKLMLDLMAVLSCFILTN